MDGLHTVLKALSVLCFTDGLRTGTKQLDTILFQCSIFMQCHSQIQTGLSTQGRQDGIRTFLLNHLCDRMDVQWLNIDMVCNILVRHDGSRVGVDQYNLNSLLLQSTAGLGSCIVKFSGLTNDNGTRTKYKNFFDFRIFWHYLSPPIDAIKRSNRYSVSFGPGLASGWNCVVKQLGRL